ncbi:hypothetical protein DAPPUDRAFT_118886 [Daphnia pulex]|uniref:Uncharacterized protein n=1 Tax=Daphnia pulex TaxID=6669 RepID=E9HWY4_DAPPU|nr:hypothetical protein DAPPUDRAFT_118886 [Daphnia pulex]|eukprot:EFX63743.1 hypothetical protein DAPPUDRAFT_118886 [Daphnia pulex]
MPVINVPASADLERSNPIEWIDDEDLTPKQLRAEVRRRDRAQVAWRPKPSTKNPSGDDPDQHEVLDGKTSYKSRQIMHVNTDTNRRSSETVGRQFTSQRQCGLINHSFTSTQTVASLCKQLVKLGLRTALDYGHSECRDSDTSEGLTGRSTRIAVPSSSTALALLLGRLVRPTVERPHPGTNPPLLLANLQPTLRAVGSHSSILISARSLYEPTHILQPKQRILLPKEITSKYRLSDRTALGPAEQLREISDEVSPSSAAFHRKSATS